MSRPCSRHVSLESSPGRLTESSQSIQDPKKTPVLSSQELAEVFRQHDATTGNGRASILKALKVSCIRRDSHNEPMLIVATVALAPKEGHDIVADRP